MSVKLAFIHSFKKTNKQDVLLQSLHTMTGQIYYRKMRQYLCAFYIFIAMIRYRYISRHPVLLNYTPILHETVFRVT